MAYIDKDFISTSPVVRNVSTFLTNQGLGVGQADAFASDLGEICNALEIYLELNIQKDSMVLNKYAQ